jgi:hypothetical protein
MSECKRDDVSRKLAMALSPQEFPSEAAELEAHLRDCQTCQEELHTLGLIDSFLREHKEALADVCDVCPSAEELAEFARGGAADPSVNAHVGCCSACSEEVKLARDLQQEDLSGGSARPTRAQRTFLQRTIEREYGGRGESWASRLTGFVEAVKDHLSFPSMLVGAVAAAALVVCLLPHGAGTGAVVPGFSAVTWDLPVPAGTKTVEPGAPAVGEPAFGEKKVALIILLSEKDHLSQSQVDHIYRQMDIATKLHGSYQFLQPKQVQAAMGIPQAVDDPDQLAQTVFTKVQANYLLFVRIEKQDALYSLKGMLYEQGQHAKRARISHMGITLDRIPSNITTIGCELLIEAEFS